MIRYRLIYNRFYLFWSGILVNFVLIGSYVKRDYYLNCIILPWNFIVHNFYLTFITLNLPSKPVWTRRRWINSQSLLIFIIHRLVYTMNRTSVVDFTFDMDIFHILYSKIILCSVYENLIRIPMESNLCRKKTKHLLLLLYMIWIKRVYNFLLIKWNDKLIICRLYSVLLHHKGSWGFVIF